MRLPLLTTLLLFFFGCCTCVRAQPDTLAAAADTLSAEPGLAERLSVTLWRQTRPDAGRDYVVHYTSEGNFEEDAGPGHGRSGRYLMGKWTVDTLSRQLTVGIDYFMGKRMVHPRYRDGQDFYLVYDIVAVTGEELVLRDVLTEELRVFVPTAVEGYQEASERRKPKPKFGELKLPGQN